MAYATYDFYKNSYFGTTVEEKEFPKLANQADLLVNSATRNRLVDDPSLVTENVQMLCCAVVDLIDDSGGSFLQDGLIRSEKVGGHTVSYSNISLKGFNEKLFDLLSLYLGGSGLLSAAVPYQRHFWGC